MKAAFAVIGATALLGTVIAQSQPNVADKAKAKYETGLVGVKILDSGLRLIQLFGNPDDIQAIGGGGGAIGPSGPGGGRGGFGAGPGGFGPPGAGGFPGRPGAGGGPGRSGGPGGLMEESITDALPGILNDSFEGSEEDRQGRPPQTGPGGPPFGGGGPGGPQFPPGGMPPLGPGGAGPGSAGQRPPFGPGGPGGFPGGFPGAPGGLGAPGAGGRGGGGFASATDRVNVTRWVYRRGASRYAFILDKFNRVVQIDAIALRDGKAKTSNGITFGSTFAQVLNKYGTPDGYEISGERIVLRYLVNNRVAFQLTRLQPKQPHRVTGIVVASGKV